MDYALIPGDIDASKGPTDGADEHPTDLDTAILQVEGLTVHLGKRPVITDVTFSVGTGELVGLFGHNGAGKTTLLRAISGLVYASCGSVQFGNEEVGRRRSPVGVPGGIAMVPQGQGVFPSLSIDENLRLGRRLERRRSSREIERTAELVRDLFPLLAERPRAIAGNLSGGQRQMVAVAMALLSQPRLLLLDEPSTGLAPVLVQEMMQAVERINRELGTSVLLVEQDLKKTLDMCSAAHVLRTGRLVFTGTAEQLRKEDWTQLF